MGRLQLARKVDVRVQVRYFAALREARGVDEEWVTCPEDETAAALYARLFPPGRGGVLPVTFARNRTQVPGETALQDGDEVVFLPPIGGG